MQRRCIYILANPHGAEANYSIESAAEIGSVLQGEIIYLSRKNWTSQIDSIYDPDALYLLSTHGGFGEDGCLHAYLEARNLRHTHSKSWSCGVMANKHHTKMLYVSLSIPTPCWTYRGTKYLPPMVVDRQEWISKPLLGGGKAGLRMEAPKSNGTRIFEEYIAGSLEISVCVVGLAGPGALPAIVRSRSRDALGVLKAATEAPSQEALEFCTSAAIRVHRALNARGVTKTDFVLDKNGRAFAIETDAHPGLGKSRATAQAALKAGISYAKLIEGICDDC